MYTARIERLWQVLKGQSISLKPKEAAQLVLQRCNVRHPPVDVEHIVTTCGIALHPVAGVAWSGAVNSNTTQASIWVRSTDATVRQRFTIAHELGHLLLHPSGMAFRDDTFSGGPLEVEANAFAAALLMPASFLQPATVLLTPTAQLARIYKVSETAMEIRLNQLGLRTSRRF